jgi:predicted Fe-Mo cluster-binding NifX family protein
MRVAVTVWDGRISPVFNTARCFRLLDVENGTAVDEDEVTLTETELGQKIKRLSSLYVHTVICGAISRTAEDLIHAHGIRLIPFIAGGAEEVATAYLEGNLTDPKWSMPGSPEPRHGARRS